MQAPATSPSILLFNDRHDPDWLVTVDGKPETLLRCNFIMRGVALSPGEHSIEFRFKPNATPMHITVAAHLAGFLILGFLLVTGRRTVPAERPAPTAPVPPTPTAPVVPGPQGKKQFRP